MEKRNSPKQNDGVWLTGESCSLEEFRSLVERRATSTDYPLAKAIERNVPIYDAAEVEAGAGDRAMALGFMAEWHRIFLDGPGIVVGRQRGTGESGFQVCAVAPS